MSTEQTLVVRRHADRRCRDGLDLEETNEGDPSLAEIRLVSFSPVVVELK